MCTSTGENHPSSHASLRAIKDAGTDAVVEMLIEDGGQTTSLIRVEGDEMEDGLFVAVHAADYEGNPFIKLGKPVVPVGVKIDLPEVACFVVDIVLHRLPYRTTDERGFKSSGIWYRGDVLGGPAKNEKQEQRKGNYVF